MQKFKNDRVLLEHAYKNVQEGVMSNIGHAALDLAGLIPGVGEAADITNAIWYCTQQPPNYLFAALSIISVIPLIGDAIGKGTKLSLLIGKVSPKIIQVKKIITNNKSLIDKIFKKCEENQKLRPYVNQIRQALNAFVRTTPSSTQTTAQNPAQTTAQNPAQTTAQNPAQTTALKGALKDVQNTLQNATV